MVGKALLALVLCAVLAGAASPGVQASPVGAGGGGGASFGSPPSGEFPILYNDHTVYAKPDILKQNRVLAALVKGGQIYVPLRSMFEAMGATVSASADGRTITAEKPGASVVVTVGKPEVSINGETRPLDVPPIVYRGIVLVPVRVISEAMGAYVQWVPDRRVVVVRFVPSVVAPPTAPPTAVPIPPTAPPVVTPTPSPTPSPTPPPSYTVFAQAAFSGAKDYNEFSAGQWCDQSYLFAAAYAPENSAFAVKVDYRLESYVTSDNLVNGFGNHYTQFATIDGGVAFTPVFLARQTTMDARLEFKVAAPRIYVGAGYLYNSTNYGYPHLSAVGLGIEKLPDLKPSSFSLYGSAFYYPSASGNYIIPSGVNAGRSYRQQYQIGKYDIGLAYVFGHSPIYIHGGLSADRYTAKQNAPINQTHDGPYIGLGVKF